MAYNEKLAARIREMISETGREVQEKKMFGGLCFMVDDNMCAGVKTDQTLIRLDPSAFEKALELPGVEAMSMKGKTSKSFIYINNEELQKKQQLTYWMQQALDYNRVLKASKKKKK